MDNKNETFTYAYSAKQQEEVERIRQKYLPPQEDRLAQLRRLDQSAERAGTAAAIALGMCGTLLLGLGMCCTMVWTQWFVLGIVIGLAGIAGVALAFPVFKFVREKRRKKLAPRVLALTEALLGRQ